MKNAKQRKKAIEKNYAKNFYVLDTETGGFDHNEPIQIAAKRYEDGKEVAANNQYFLPTKRMTDSALKIHGLDRDKLKSKGAKNISKGQLGILVNFLNERKDQPIVAHSVKYDRDKVLKPAFKKLDVLGMMPR